MIWFSHHVQLHLCKTYKNYTTNTNNVLLSKHLFTFCLHLGPIFTEQN